MEIHQMTATDLLAAFGRGRLSSVEATRALIERIEAHDDATNAVVVRRFHAALAEAEAADAARAAGAAVGPLCGLPITLKENLDLEGFDSTMGLVANQGRPAARDAVVVAALRRAGAVVLGKTNVPQLLLAQETENAIWGVTKNPWNLDRVPGGSSGGEAAAIAAGYAPVGYGTDIGGSIRIPAHFCGIAGLKPTVDRVSRRGQQGAIAGQELVEAQGGPMARSVDDLALIMRVLDPVAQSAADPAVPPLALGEAADVNLKGLRVGWYDEDGYLAPTASIRRAVRGARDALRAAGATLVDFRPPDRGEVVFLWLAAMTSDGGRTVDGRLAGEAASPQLKPSRQALALPGTARKLMAAVLERTGDRRVARLLREVGEKGIADWWAMATRRTAMRRAEFDAWAAADLDAVICPPHATPAMSHRQSGDFALALSYPFRYSLLDFPAGVVPVTRVRADDVTAPLPGADRIEQKQATIDRESVGLPVGVQVVARPWREDVALAVMRAIETAARGADGYPNTPLDPGHR